MPGEEGIDYVIAPHAISGAGVDEGRKVYGVGDRVPMADAIRYGLVKGPEKPKPKAKPRGKRKTTSRARKPQQDRARRPSKDRSA